MRTFSAGNVASSTFGISVSRRTLLSGLGTIGAAAVPLLARSGGAAARESPQTAHEGRESVADTAYGKIRGIQSPDGIRTFKGIPYGADTSGENRFLPPKRPKSWTDVRDTTRWGPRSPQMSGSGGEIGLFFYFGSDDIGPVSEDCLNLNLWTKGTRDNHKRPVMVRIHGGGFTTGTGNYPMYRGHNVAREGDVVYVSVNHRLASVGYLDLSSLGDERFAQSGNAGMLDLVAALEWIRDNIENFGGDPGNVTLMGESGGGFKICTLLGMPRAKGLFHRAIVESGPGLALKGHAEAAELTERFLLRLELDKSKYADLQKMPLARLMEAQALTVTNRYYPHDLPVHVSYGPIVDGEIIPQNMFDPVATPLSADVPIIIGYNKNEGTFFNAQDPHLYELDEAGMASRVKSIEPKMSERVIDVYRAVYPNLSPTDLLVQISTDSVMGAPSVLLAERKAALGGAPVYMYRFDWPSPAFGGKLGATHGLEIAFVNDTVDVMPVMTHERPDAALLARKVSSAWVAFARTGNPSTDDLPRWSPYTQRNRATMLLDTTSTLAVDPITENVRVLWRDLLPVRRFGM
jgi:para-nitrobenzyl esterase